MNWYYSQAGVQQGPVEAQTIQQLLQDRQLQGSDLAWQPGMSTWGRLDQLAEFGNPTPNTLAPTHPPEEQCHLSPQQVEMLNIWAPLIQERKWVKFIGVFMLVYGILSALTLIGIPFIFAGFWMMRGASLLEQMETSPHPALAREVNQEMAKSVKLYAIMLLIYLIFMATVFLLYLLFILFFVVFGVFTGASSAATGS